jgi:hypothetical protein
VIRASVSRDIACVVLALCCAASPAAAASSEFEFVPDPDATSALLSGSTWIATGSDFTLRLQRLDEQERRAFIEKTTGSPTDPFASPPGRKPGFVTFVMQLENNGASNLEFRSQQCWLVTNKNEILHPIGSEGLRARYGLVGREMSPAYESSLVAVMPTTRTLYPEESLAGLLVYRAFKPSTKRYRLDIQITTPNGDVALITLPYRRVKLERSEGR